MTLPEWLAKRLRHGLAGVCLFGDNIESLTQLRALTAEILAASPLAIIAIDEEGGDVTRLFYDVGSPFPGNAILGRIDDEVYTAEVAAKVGRQLREAGCTLSFAPDVDINSNPNNPVIGVRSFGTDPALVARHSAAWILSLQATGVAASAKHFPGHGDTAQDSHLALPVVDRSLDELRERELVPFVAAIGAGSATIMTSHILMPQLDSEAPATLSRPILQGLLREELGYQGVIVSDALDMAGASAITGIPEAAVRALAAGCDLLCIGTDNSDAQLTDIQAAITAAVADGRLDAQRLADAVERTRVLAVRSAANRNVVSAPDAEGFGFDLARTAAAFDVQPGVAVRTTRLMVALENDANLAVGVAPWATDADTRLREGDQLPVLADGTQLVLVGRDNHRYGWVRALVDESRRKHPSVVVVDMGWPGDDRAYADVATFGASRHGGDALRHWLEHKSHDGSSRDTSSMPNSESGNQR